MECVWYVLLLNGNCYSQYETYNSIHHYYNDIYVIICFISHPRFMVPIISTLNHPPIIQSIKILHNKMTFDIIYRISCIHAGLIYKF